MLTVTDFLYTINNLGASVPLPRAAIPAAPTQLPIYVKDSSGTFRLLQNPVESTLSDTTGKFTLTLPWPSETDIGLGAPATVPWQLTTTDGTIWQGNVPEGVAGPVTIRTLEETYGWITIATPTLPTSTAPSALTDKGGQLFNVKAYAAVGNGVTDDSVAIRTAIAAALAAGGGTIYFPTGTYLVSKDPSTPANSAQCAIRVPQAVTLQGANEYATILKLANSQNCDVISTLVSTDGIAQNASFVGIKDLTIDGNRANQAATPDVISSGFAAAAGAAGVLTGTYAWGVTFVTSGVESPVSIIVPNAETTLTAQQGALSAIPTGPAGTTARKIYRSKSSNQWPLFLSGVVADNSTTTYTDNIADAALGAIAPSGGGINVIHNPQDAKSTNDVTTDPHNYFANLFIRNVIGCGYYASGKSECRLYNMHVEHASQHGYVTSYDHYMTDCSTGATGACGFFIQHNTILLGCKAFFAGDLFASYGHGFWIAATYGVTLSGCYSQDNQASGFYLDSSDRCTLASCVADSNSTRGAGLNAGFDLWGHGSHRLIGCVAFERQVASTQTFGLRIRNGSKGNSINLQHSAQPGATVNAAIMTADSVVTGNALQLNAQGAPDVNATAGAFTYTPDPYAKGDRCLIGPLTGNLTIAAPTSIPTQHTGALLTISIQNDAAGAHTITWNGAYKSNIDRGAFSLPTASGAANTYLVVAFIYDGTNWIQTN